MISKQEAEKVIKWSIRTSIVVLTTVGILVWALIFWSLT